MRRATRAVKSVALTRRRRVVNPRQVTPGSKRGRVRLGGIGSHVIQGERMGGADKIVGVRSQ